MSMDPPQGQDESSRSKKDLISELLLLRRRLAELEPSPGEPAAQARLAAIVECSEDAIISKNLRGIIRTWNAGAERIKGHRPAEAIGQNFSQFFTAEDRRVGLPGEILARAAAELQRK